MTVDDDNEEPADDGAGGDAVDAFKSVAYASEPGRDKDGFTSLPRSFSHSTVLLPLLDAFCNDPHDDKRLQDIQALVRLRVHGWNRGMLKPHIYHSA